MKFLVEREDLLHFFKQINITSKNNPTMPILGNILLNLTKNNLFITSTNLEIEIIIKITPRTIDQLGTITVSAHKFFSIFRSFSEKTKITVELHNDRLLISTSCSRYLLATLPAVNFPKYPAWDSKIEVILSTLDFKKLVESTYFSMAHQDVRYYLNGMFLEIEGKIIRTVSTDGHRLAICEILMQNKLSSFSIIIPRKSIIELIRILENNLNVMILQIGHNNIRINIGNYIFTSKLIDGRFPDYRRVFPNHPNIIFNINRNVLKKSFSRVEILANDKLHGVKLYLKKNQMKITSNNFEQEEAEELIDIIYHGNDIEISVNVKYILDVLNALTCEDVRFFITDAVSGIQIEDSIDKTVSYIIMPMRL